MGCLILSSFAAKSVGLLDFSFPSDTAYISESDDSKGYRDIVLFRKKLVAVGTDGRIDNITTSGEIVPVDHSFICKLNCAVANDDIVIAAGDGGTILYSADGKRFDRIESGIDKNIYCITSQNGLILAGTDKGVTLVSKDGKSWNSRKTGAKGNILSLSTNNTLSIGVTDAGEILKSFDGFKWEIKDYNKEYAGYNPYSNFKKISATQNSIVIIGSHKDGSPAVLFSSMGNVWVEREPFYYDDQDMICYLTGKPNDLTYDPIRNQFLLACDDGELFSLPTCIKCNKYTKISEKNLHALITLDNCLCIVGDDFAVFIQRF